MGKMILISDDDLKDLIQEGITNAVDTITKKIASRAARVYNNEIFRHRAPIVESCGSTSHSSGCGWDDDDDNYYSGCGSSNTGGGCGSSSSRSNGGCGWGDDGGC